MWPTNFITLILICSVFGEKVFLGGIFDESDTEDPTVLTDQQAFKAAVSLANKKFEDYGIEFETVVEDSLEDDAVGPFRARFTTCSLISKQTLVIFGPSRDDEIDMVQSICDAKDVAHVVTKWMYNPGEHSLVNLYPHYSYLTIAYFNILLSSGWKSFTIFYENNESILRLGDLINVAKNEGLVVNVKQLDEVGDEVYRTTLKEALHSGEENFLIDCNIKILEEVLRQAQQVGLMTGEYNFFITNFDLQTVNLEPFQYSEANITGIRIFDPNSELIEANIDTIKEFNDKFDVNKMRTETALLMDAVSVTTDIISNKLPLETLEVGEISCDSMQTLKHGDTISNHIKTSKSKGLTGLVEFDGDGFRHNFNLEVLQLSEEGLVKIGNWNISKGVVITRFEKEDPVEETDSLKNTTLKTAPYCMLKETSNQLFGNDRFEGFAIDLIHELSLVEGFNYTFIIREDKKNGAKDAITGDWSGMIGDVMDGAADLAITDLTVTAEREEAVDFTTPFMNLGISILAKKPQNAPPSFFSFADPFALDTWIGIAVAYVAVSLSFFILGRLCQDEWTNPYPCIKEPEHLINQFSLANSFWFSIGTFMQQGSEIAPIGTSTRMVAGMWYFFILIIAASCYPANLTAFLATPNTVIMFTDVDSLIKNMEKYELKLGAKAKGATEGFFKGKEGDVYQTVYEYMQAHPEDMVGENKDGVQKAIKENYAFFMESTSIEYEIQRHCELQQYGKLLDDKGYGIAMRKNSTYRKRLSTAVLKLQSSGEIDNLKRRWWEEKRGGGQCSEEGSGVVTTDPIGIQNVQGVFYVTIGGTILAILLVIAEMLIAIYKDSKKLKIPFKEALKNELKSFMDFNSDVKPPLKQKSKSRSKSKEGSDSSEMIKVAAPYGFIPTINQEKYQE